MKRKRSFLVVGVSVALVLALGLAVAVAQEVVVPLDAELGGAEMGTATITTLDPGSIRVDVTASGLPPNTTLSNHIHGGTCNSPGGTPHFLLSNIVTDDQGNASASTTLAASMSDLAGLIIIIPHVPAGGSPTLCGAIPTGEATDVAVPATVVAGASAVAAEDEDVTAVDLPTSIVAGEAVEAPGGEASAVAAPAPAPAPGPAPVVAGAAVAAPAPAPAPAVAGVTALPATGGVPLPLLPAAVLSALSVGAGLFLRRRRPQ